MKKEDFISPFVLLVVFSVILTCWLSFYLHASFQFSHLHVVERMMFSAYFIIIALIAISMGFGLLVLVFSGVLWTVQKILGVEQEKADDAPAS